MAQQIKKKFIGSDQIDGSKIKLLEGQSIRGTNSLGEEVDLVKISSQDKVQVLGQDVALKSELDTEATRVDGLISSEEARAVAEELRLEGLISQEANDRETADESLSSSISSLQSQVAIDIQQAISNESSLREAADSALSDLVDIEKARIDAILLASDADKDSFAEIVSLINSVDTENDSAFAGYILSNNAAVSSLQSGLSQEILDRQAADNLKENLSNKSSDVLLGTSEELYPSQNAVKTYADNQDKKVVESTFSGVALSDFLPNPNSIETQIRHYSNGTALASDKKYAAYFTDTQVIFVNAVNPYASKITHTFVIPTAGSNFPQAMTSIGNFVYMVTGAGRLYCFDWSDKLNPLNLGFVTIGTGQHFDVTTDGVNTLFIANTTNKRVYIVDITNRSAATLTTSLVLGTGATDFGTGVSFSSNYLYVSNYNNKIHVMTNTSGSWAQVATIPTIVNPCRGTVFTNSSGQKVFFVQRYNGVNMAVYDLLNPALPVELKQLTAPASIQIYNLPFIFEDVIHIGLDNGQIGGVNLFNKTDIKFAGIFEPKNADGSKKFSSMRGLVRAETDSPFFKKKTFLLATGVINGSGSTQKVTTVLDLPMFDYIRSSAVTQIPEVDLSEIESDISNLQQSLTDVELQLQSQINNILSNTEPSALDSLTEIVSAFQSADGNLNQAITNLTNDLSGDIESEAQAREDADNALDLRIDVLEAKGYAKDSLVVGSELAYVDLDREYSILLSVAVGRLMVHEDEDFTVSVVDGKTRLTWIGSLVNPSGDEAIETGDKVFYSGAF